MALDLLEHALAHPAAEDTIDGLAEWWVLTRQVTTVRLDVRLAVTDLLRRGLLRAHPGPDGRIRYRLDDARADDARALLRSMGRA